MREGSFGGNITKDYLEQPVVVSFRGTSSGKWVERKVTISKTAKTLKIDPVTEQIKFRAVDEEGNTVEGASFTVKRKDTQINPDSDSTYTLVKDTAYTVEAGADGFEAQTFNYTPDGTETEHTVTLIHAGWNRNRTYGNAEKREKRRAENCRIVLFRACTEYWLAGKCDGGNRSRNGWKIPADGSD